MKTDHGPDCYACNDPAGAARQIAEQRAQIKAARSRARQHREWADWVKAKFYLFAGATDAAEFRLVQGLMEHHYGTANALAGGASFDSAHLDRVAKAHPALPTRLTEQQGGIPNDAYTADDTPKGM